MVRNTEGVTTMSQIGLTEVAAQQVAVIRRTIQMSELGAFYTAVLGAVSAAVQRAGGAVAGPPFGWYHGTPTDTADVAGGFPVSGLAEGALDGEVAVLERPACLAAAALHIGPFETLADTYRELDAWLNDRQLDRAEHSWEEYLSDPETQPDPEDWQTRIVWPLQ
jgi:effector-binding domain-containing protein